MSNMVQTWSNLAPDMIQTRRHSIDIFFRPCCLSDENFKAVARLNVEVGHTHSRHGPRMVQKIMHSFGMPLRLSLLVLKINVHYLV